MASSLAVSWIREPFGVYRARTQAGTASDGTFVQFVFSRINNYRGLLDLYAGYVPSAVTSMVNRGIYFSLYKLVQDKLTTENSASSTGVSFPLHVKVLAAACAGCLSSLSVYPLDVVRARMRGMDPSETTPKYSSFRHCFEQSAREGALFRGKS